MARIFLSYVRTDEAKARTIASALEKAGHSVWWDRHITGGSQFSKQIEQALADAEAVVVLWSAASVESAWVRDEAAIGRDSNRLVPVRVDQTLPPLGFRQHQTIDLGGGRIRTGSGGMRALFTAIDALTHTIDQPIGSAGPYSKLAERPAPRRLSRRTVAASLVAAAAASAGAGFLILGDRETPASPEATALMAQAWQAWAQGTGEGNNQAIGLYRRAISLAPDHADAWGFLGCAYGDRAHAWATAAERPVLRERAREAGRRALELDPRNAYGRAAIAYARPMIGNWLTMEQAFRRAIQDQPEKWLVSYSLALLLTRVGRVSEAATLFGKLGGTAPTATQYLLHIEALWASGQLDEAERLMDEAVKIYATHPVIWLTRFDMLMHGGRGDAAIALAQDEATRPSSLPEQSVSELLAVARAMLGRNQADIDAVIATHLQYARQSAWQAEKAIHYASALGRVDDAFAIANAYYFSRGFVVPDQPPAANRPVEATLDERDTRFLFLPGVRAMRADPRFERLVAEIGLVRYWRDAGHRPDYGAVSANKVEEG